MEDAVHIALVDAEEYRAEQGSQQTRQIQIAHKVFVVYAVAREIGDEKCRKHQRAHDKCAANWDFVKFVKGKQATEKHHKSDNKWHS